MAGTITCSFLFTPEEFKTTAVLARRSVPTWKRTAYLLFFAFCWAIVGKSIPALILGRHGIDYSGLMPVFMMTFVTVYVVTKFIPARGFCSTRSFRKRSYCNRNFASLVSEEGIATRTDDSAGTPLVRCARAREMAEGFAVYPSDSGGDFVWFPRHGFSCPEDIARCGEIIRSHLIDYRQF